MLTAVSIDMGLPQPQKWQPVFMTLGFLELSLGLAASAAADFISLFYALAMVGGALGVFSLAYCVVRSGSVKVYDILGAAVLFGYGTGTLISVMSFAAANQELLQLSMVSEYWLTRTLGLVIAACGFLHVIGRFDPGGLLFSPKARADSGPNRPRVLWFVVPLCILFCTLLAMGRIGYMGNVFAGGANASVSPLASIVLLLATPAGALSLVEALKPQRRGKLVLLVTAALFLSLQFGLGRRVLLFSMVTYAMAALLIWRPSRLVSVRNLAIVVLAVLLVQAATTAFFALRMATYSFGKRPAARVSILELIPRAYKIYRQDRGGDLQAGIRENVKSRTFVLEYLAQISEGESEREPLLGEDLHRAFLVSLPSVLYAGKLLDKDFMAEESLINPRFGLPVWDASNSAFTAAVADFGAPGMFMYPAFFCIAFTILLRITHRWAPPVVGLILSLSLCQTLLGSETDIAGYFVSFRSMVLITAVAWLYFGFHWNARREL